MHTDDEFAKGTIFGRRVLGGPCTIPFVAGLSGHAWHGLWEKSGMRLLALVGINNIAFKSPLFPNDTIWVEIEIAAAHALSIWIGQRRRHVELQALACTVEEIGCRGLDR